MELIKEREKVAAFMRRLYDQKLTTVSGGNVSLRIGDRILITPSQIDKAKIVGEQIAILTMDGKIHSQRHKKSMESGMHLAIYSRRPEVRAVVHAHPVFATSFAISGKKIKTSLAGESRAVLGEPVLAKYALMGTQELAEIVAEASLKSNAIMMQNHGVITLGETLFQAYDRMEVLEASAKMTMITELLGGSQELSPDQLREIDNLFI
ncbi:MAG: class II aldolase/adducin family protein [Bacteroidetes bacterium]|nr:class II aldolase/adducin family protein [Bacteroidota bacterium]